ncbi:MAG TPA: hypothetical protein VFM79_13630 [Pelobium sp.]|nr:hypothetical protein [Pelobium sp.]
MKTLLKSATLIIALVLTNSLTFAAAKIPEVYVAQSSLSDLSVNELLSTIWFWILIVVTFVVMVAALYSSKDQESANHFPEHAI